MIDPLDVLLPNATEFHKIAIADANRRAGDLGKGMPAPGSAEELALMEMGAMALEALGWHEPHPERSPE